MSKTLTLKQRNFLVGAGATPEEVKIYSIVLKQYKKLSRPLQNSDIASVHESHRTNIRAHLANMIRKGIVKRHLHKFYLPVEEIEKAPADCLEKSSTKQRKKQ